MDAIIGASIAIVSGFIAQFLNNLLEIKKEKEKMVFEKIQEIINSISLINEGLNKDLAMSFGVAYPNDSMEKLSFEITKLKCLVKIYHPTLSEAVNKLTLSTDNYFKSKVSFANAQRSNESVEILRDRADDIKYRFQLCTNEINDFVNSLENYGTQKFEVVSKRGLFSKVFKIFT
ncbi:hypothetical protein [Flavobacterium anhuiense]|uniref:hypothetical protein n=1 Tax=Flavobacterium anhuiense TaxID=459526 RepID=UPI003D963DA4